MASIIFNTNDFPTFTGKESPKEQIAALCDYLFEMQQQLQYILNNLGEGNWNPTSLQSLKTDIRTDMPAEKAVKQTKDGWAVGESGKDLNLVGNIYINGTLFMQEEENNDTA